MIRFRHLQQTIELAPSDTWAERVPTETYRDTPSPRLVEIVRSIEAGNPWRDVVAAQYAIENPWLYAIVTSPQRDLFFRQHPPAAGARVLDIGSGWGQIALPLANQANVTALEPTPERLAFIRAAARQEGVDQHMQFIEGDFFSVEFESRFDLACCIGVLEWIPKFRPGNPRDVQIDFLSRCRRLLAPQGKLVVGIENRLGLKYLLGANDDHIGVPSLMTYDAALAEKKWQTLRNEPLRVFTFTQPELADLLTAAGFRSLEFYTAFPDYKLPQTILPWGTVTDTACKQGAPAPEHDGSCGRALAFQEELSSHYKSLADLGTASAFAPSFFVSASI